MYYITFDLKGEDKGTENPDMYYCEFMPEHTMCKYPVCRISFVKPGSDKP